MPHRLRVKKVKPTSSLLIAAIREQAVLKFSYNGQVRWVEPQTYGLSTTGKEVLRGHQVGSRPGNAPPMAKLFEVAKMKQVEKTKDTFYRALKSHNPNDSAMTEIFATLPRPEKNNHSTRSIFPTRNM